MPEEDQGRWQKFVSDQLNDMNEKNARELGGHNPMHFSSDDDADTDYRELQFTAGSTQQVGPLLLCPLCHPVDDPLLFSYLTHTRRVSSPKFDQNSQLL